MRIYAYTERGELALINDKRVLLALQCDHCDAQVRPHKEIAQSGWTTRGEIDYGKESNRVTSWEYCPDCSGDPCDKG